MIRHIVFFSAKEPSDLDEIEAGLRILEGNPHTLRFSVQRNLKRDTIAGPQPDFVVIADVEDEAELAAYKAHPLYAESIRRVRPLRDLRIAADVQFD